MAPALAILSAIAGPFINGAVSLATKPKTFAKEAVKDPITLAASAPAYAAMEIAEMPQTEEQAVYVFLCSLASVLMVLYKKKRA